MPMAHFLCEKAIDMGLTRDHRIQLCESLNQAGYVSQLWHFGEANSHHWVGYHAWRRSDSHWYVQSRTKFDKTTTSTRLGETGTT
jgi:hypothetical protein